MEKFCCSILVRLICGRWRRIERMVAIASWNTCSRRVNQMAHHHDPRCGLTWSRWGRFPHRGEMGFLPKDDRPRYLICNGDESEPGTFKDRVLLEDYPHLVLEGLIISCYAVRVRLALFTCAANFSWVPGGCRRPLMRPMPRGISARTFSAPTCNSTSCCTGELGLHLW